MTKREEFFRRLNALILEVDIDIQNDIKLHAIAALEEAACIEAPDETSISVEKRNNAVVQNEDDSVYIKNGDCFEAGAKWMKREIFSMNLTNEIKRIMWINELNKQQ